jgi:hypothetical protein
MNTRNIGACLNFIQVNQNCTIPECRFFCKVFSGDFSDTLQG